MRKFFFLCSTLILLSCNNNQQAKSATADSISKETNASADVIKSEPKQAEEALVVVDTGQTWFRVRITKK